MFQMILEGSLENLTRFFELIPEKDNTLKIR